MQAIRIAACQSCYRHATAGENWKKPTIQSNKPRPLRTRIFANGRSCVLSWKQQKAHSKLECRTRKAKLELPELIEGMEVSIDVSSDADLGNRYFGTVTEASELDTAKNGYKGQGSGRRAKLRYKWQLPVTPEQWISCSDRMPERARTCLISVNFDNALWNNR